MEVEVEMEIEVGAERVGACGARRLRGRHVEIHPSLKLRQVEKG